MASGTGGETISIGSQRLVTVAIAVVSPSRTARPISSHPEASASPSLGWAYCEFELDRERPEPGSGHLEPVGVDRFDPAAEKITDDAGGLFARHSRELNLDADHTRLALLGVETGRQDHLHHVTLCDSPRQSANGQRPGGFRAPYHAVPRRQSRAEGPADRSPASPPTSTR